MVNWRVTAATLRCDMVGEEVTILVYKDWSVKCTAYSRRASAGKSVAKYGQNPGCEGTGCRVASEYLKKLQSEEEGK